MPYYRAVGHLPRKRHTQFSKPDGGLYAEELMGTAGFSGPSALLYHEHPPTAVVQADIWERPEEPMAANHPLLPRHLQTHKLDADGGDVVTGRRLLLANADLRLSYVVADQTSPLYRNAEGDECVYLEAGRATLETVFGALAVGPGDYVVIPTSTTHRWLPANGEDGPLRALVIEASGHVGPPGRYLSATGQMVEQAPYCERDLRAPSQVLLADGQEVEVLVRHGRAWPVPEATSPVGTRYVFSTHPFDVVGWDGGLYPYAFNIADFEPRVGRVHLPPPVHQTFEGPNFVVCSFCPRPLDFDPDAVPVPYNHANVDSDEVLFYVGGDFMSRKGSGIEIGSVSLHPAGFIHGPQPGSVEAAIGRPGPAGPGRHQPRTDEWAVMIDTFRPLALGPAGIECEDPGYRWTWVAHR